MCFNGVAEYDGAGEQYAPAFEVGCYFDGRHVKGRSPVDLGQTAIL